MEKNRAKGTERPGAVGRASLDTENSQGLAEEEEEEELGPK